MVIAVLAFFVRHLLMTPFAIVAGCILWSIAYLLLLLVAMIGNYGLGDPLAYPAEIVAIFAAAIPIGWGVFAPASATGAVFCKLFKLPKIAAIPVVFGSAHALSYLLYSMYLDGMTTYPSASPWIMLKHFVIYLSVPLGAYWWLTEGPGAFFEVFRRWIGSRRLVRKEGE